MTGHGLIECNARGCRATVPIVLAIPLDEVLCPLHALVALIGRYLHPVDRPVRPLARITTLADRGYEDSRVLRRQLRREGWCR